MQVAQTPTTEGQGANKKRPRASEKTEKEAIVQIPGTPKQYSTNAEFISSMIRMKAEQMPIADGKIFVASRTDKVVDVWKVKYVSE